MDDNQRRTLLDLRDVLFHTHLRIGSLKNQLTIWQDKQRELEALIDELEGSYGADDAEAAGKIG